MDTLLTKSIRSTSFSLKIIAALTMLVDHVGLILFPGELVFRIIGRISFPLFALLLAEGFRKTNNRRRYFLRLGIFALISQVPYYLAVSVAAGFEFKLNILFTFLFGFGALLAYTQTHHILLKILSFAVMALMAEFFGADYGAYGIMVIAACYLILDGRKFIGSILFVTMSVFGAAFQPFSAFVSSLQIFAVMAVPLVLTYSGEKGGYTLSKYFFYWFYPLHLLLLFIVWAVFF